VKPLKAPIHAVVFDLDDTLYPEVQYVRSGFRAVAARLADPQHDPEQVFTWLWEVFETGPRDRVFNEVVRKLGRRDGPQEIAELVSVYRCHRPRLSLDAETRAMLEVLKGRYKLGLITDGYLPTQRLKVEALGLERFLEPIIYTEQLGREFWKPHPRAFELMCEKLTCRPTHCVYVADNPAKDFLAPNRLGWQSVQMCRPERVHRPAPAEPEGLAHVTVHNPTELLALLKNTSGN